MSPRSSIDQSPLRRALPRAGLGLSLLAAVALMGGAWGAAYGQTVPPMSNTPEDTFDILELPAGPALVAHFEPPAGEPAVGAPDVVASLTTPDGEVIGSVAIDSDFFSNQSGTVGLEVTAAPPIDPSTFQQTGESGAPMIHILGSVLQARLDAVDPATGEPIALDPAAAGATVTLSLPALPMARDVEPVYLVEVLNQNGESLGFMRVIATFDSATDTLRFDLPAGIVASDPRIVPATIDPAPIAVDPSALVFSSPFEDAIAFGEAGEGANFEVIGPPVAGRLPIRDVMTGALGWVDAPALMA